MNSPDPAEEKAIPVYRFPRGKARVRPSLREWRLQPGHSSNPPGRKEAVGKCMKGKIPTGSTSIRHLHTGSGRVMSLFANVSLAATGSVMLFFFCGMLAGCANLGRVFVAVERSVADGKRSNDLYKSDGSQESYPADARQGSKCWHHAHG